MSRTFKALLIAVGAAFFISTGVVAGLVLASSGDDDADQASSGDKGYLGLTVSTVFGGAKAGLRVATIEKDGPADKGGVMVGDMLRSVDAQVVHTPEQLRSATEAKAPGEKITLTLERNDLELQLGVTLAAAPANVQIESTPGNPPPDRPQAAQANRGRLGVQIAVLTPQLRERLGVQRESGIVVTEVNAGSAGAAAGLQRGDVILRVGTMQIGGDILGLQRTLAQVQTGQEVEIEVARGAETAVLSARLPASP